MVAEAVVWPTDDEAAVGRWLAAQGTAVGDRVGPEYDQAVALPQATVTRVAGPPEAAEYQVDVWGASRQQAQAACADVCTALDGLAGAVQDGVLLAAAAVVSARPLPDEGQPRYIADVIIATGTAA